MLFHSITLTDLLSFNETTLELRPLNVLIGPNASGKSNLISAIGLLKAAPGNLPIAISWGGGVRQWISKRQPARVKAAIQTEIELSSGTDHPRYSLEFSEHDLGFRIISESLRSIRDRAGSMFFERSPGA